MIGQSKLNKGHNSFLGFLLVVEGAIKKGRHFDVSTKPEEFPMVSVAGVADGEIDGKYCKREWVGRHGVVIFPAFNFVPFKGEKGAIAGEVMEGAIIRAKAWSKRPFAYDLYVNRDGVYCFFINHDESFGEVIEVVEDVTEAKVEESMEEMAVVPRKRKAKGSTEALLGEVEPIGG